MKWNRWTAALAAVFAIVAADAFAQLGSLRGKLVDEDGNPIADVKCVIEISGGGGRRTKAKTKKDGQFTKGGLRPGVYTIICEKEGYRKLPLQTQVSAYDQANVGEQVLYKLAPGELSEEQHARATKLLEQFNMAAETGNNEETLEKLFELQKMMPQSKEIEFNIASTYEKMSEKDKAIEHYTIAAEEPTLAYDSWLAVADLHGKAKEWADAAAAMKKAMDIKATDPIAMYNYAVYAQNAGDVDTAQSAYEKALELDPKRAVVHYQLGLIAVNKGETDAAIEHFEEFLELAPDHPQAEAAKGVIEALKAKESNP